MILVTTASGSRYEFDDELTQVARVQAGLGPLRRDGEWMILVEAPTIELGKGILMYLMLRDDGVITQRYTNDVTGIETIENVAAEAVDSSVHVD